MPPPATPEPRRRRRVEARADALPRSPWLRAAFAAGVPLLAVALGGATARWSQGVVLALVGVALLFAPPRFSLGKGINAVLLGLLLLALTAFLPARWFMTPGWRAALTDDFGVTLPATLGPQPWLSLESLVLFLGGIGWFYLMAAANWTPTERPRAGRFFAGGVIVLAAASVALYRLHTSLPWWHSQYGFGPFPNRNQTADFLAVGALPVLACAHGAWRGGRRGAAAGWLAGWAVVAAALFNNYSRAGIGILFAGTAVYAGGEMFRTLRRRDEDRPGKAAAAVRRWRAPALAASLVMLLAAGFMIFGGETLQRLRPASADAALTAATGEFRLRIQRDALDLVADSPWCGVGLGSFEPIFAMYRTRSALDLHAVHPESDWVWTLTELGWPAPLLLLAGVLLLARRMWPQPRGADRPWRAASALGVAAFALHAFVDVPAHRPGTVWCALFLAGLALPAPREGGPDFRVPSRWPGVVFRLLGVVLLAAGVLWLLADRGKAQFPGSQEVARLAAVSHAESDTGEYAVSVASATRGLALDPVNWRLYFQRAQARLDAGEDHDAALADFRRVRYLEPFQGRVAEIEARAWAAVGEPDLAASALLEACRREPKEAGGYFASVFSAAGGDPEFTARLAAATRRDPALELLYLEQLPPADRGRAIASIAAADPDLRRYDDTQRARLFRLWLVGDPPSLAAAMESHPAWQKLGWRWWADACTHLGAFDRACRIAAQFAPKPDLPPDPPPTASGGLALEDLRRAAEQSPGNLTAALRYSRAQQAAGDIDGALATLHRITARPGGCPAYFHYLEATLATDAGRWVAGWDAWQKYLATLPLNV